MVVHPSYYDACDVSCDVIYYVIAVRARRMLRIFFLPDLGNRPKSDPCSYELFCLESHILSFPKVSQIPPESPCIRNEVLGEPSHQTEKGRRGFTETSVHIYQTIPSYS